jgi:hypothetical protein
MSAMNNLPRHGTEPNAFEEGQQYRASGGKNFYSGLICSECHGAAQCANDELGNRADHDFGHRDCNTQPD